MPHRDCLLGCFEGRLQIVFVKTPAKQVPIKRVLHRKQVFPGDRPMAGHLHKAEQA